MENALTIWAVIGPLLAAALSSLWARRNQKQDRIYEENQRDIARQHAAQDAQIEFHRITSQNDRRDLRSALTDFIASSGDFVDAAISHIGTANKNNAFTLSKERSEMSKQAITAVLVSPPALAESIAETCNSSIAMMSLLGKPDQEQLEKFIRAYRIQKDLLLAEAHKVLGKNFDT